MRLRIPSRWQVFAFLYAAIVPFGLLFGPLYLVGYLDTSVPGGEVAPLIAGALVAFAGTITVGAHAPTGIDKLLPAMIAGVVVVFSGLQLVVWQTLSAVAMFFGMVALGLVVAGCGLGALISGRGVPNRWAGSDVAFTGGIVVAVAVLTALVSGTSYWMQDAPAVYRVASMLLLIASPVVGITVVWRGHHRLWVFLPLLAALPFVVVVASIVTAPIALVFDLPASGLLTIDDAAIDLSLSVTALVGGGAIIARVGRYLKSNGGLLPVVKTE